MDGPLSALILKQKKIADTEKIKVATSNMKLKSLIASYSRVHIRWNKVFHEAFLPLLSVKWPFVGQPDNFICLATSMPMAPICPDLHALNCKNCSQIVNWILVDLENYFF